MKTNITNTRNARFSLLNPCDRSSQPHVHYTSTETYLRQFAATWRPQRLGGIKPSLHNPFNQLPRRYRLTSLCGLFGRHTTPDHQSTASSERPSHSSNQAPRNTDSSDSNRSSFFTTERAPSLVASSAFAALPGLSAWCWSTSLTPSLYSTSSAA